MIVFLPRELLEKLEAAAIVSAPEEACGLLLGEERDSIIIRDCIVTENVADGDKARHFEIDPIEHLRLQRQSRNGGPQIIGVWHSHPNGVAELSEADKKQSIESGWVWLVTASKNAVTETKAFVASPCDSQIFTAADLKFTH